MDQEITPAEIPGDKAMLFRPETHQAWARLCEECNTLMDAYFTARANAPNFMNTSRATIEELGVYAAEAQWEDCKRRMTEFDEKHFQPSRL
jgi:hypothetical protein